MPAPCHNTHNRAFTHPAGSSKQSIRAAIKICELCPIRKQCATDALTAGASPVDGHVAPASDVIQAGVHCRGDFDTVWQLATIAGVEVPDYEGLQQRRNFAPEQCANCAEPMVKWGRYKVPEGFVLHYARGYCSNCRTAYRKKYPPTPRPLRKPINRRNHSSPPARRDSETTIQLPLILMKDLTA